MKNPVPVPASSKYNPVVAYVDMPPNEGLDQEVERGDQTTTHSYAKTVFIGEAIKVPGSILKATEPETPEEAADRTFPWDRG